MIVIDDWVMFPYALLLNVNVPAAAQPIRTLNVVADVVPAVM